MSSISFIIPCYRSEGTIAGVVSSIHEVMNGAEYDYEIVCINDCSPDNVEEVLGLLVATDAKVKAYSLTKNCGKHAALMAGLSVSGGDIIVTLDDDGETPIERLWDLVSMICQGYDVAVAKFTSRKVTLLKKVESKINSITMEKLLGKPKGLTFSSFCARKKWVVAEMLKYSGPYPYLEGLTLQITHNVANVEMTSHSRISGKSGFTFKKSLALWLNGYTLFSVLPLRMPMVFAFLCILGAILTVILGIVGGSVLEANLYVVILILAAGIFFSLGVLGEYVGRAYLSMGGNPQYVMRKIDKTAGDQGDSPREGPSLSNT